MDHFSSISLMSQGRGTSHWVGKSQGIPVLYQMIQNMLHQELQNFKQLLKLS